jgi:hypothetical protein
MRPAVASDRAVMAWIDGFDRELARIMRYPGLPKRVRGPRARRMETRRRELQEQARDLLRQGREP